MNILVVGGTGLIGAHAAIYLRQQGHEVTLCARHPVEADSPLTDFAFLQGDYREDSIPVKSLKAFDWMLFAAAADIRQQAPGSDDEAFFRAANTEAIPRFFQRARDAGIRRVVYIGSYYPQVAPDKIASSPYVRSRHLADEAVRAMSDENFTVLSLNAPFVLGHVDGLYVPHLAALVQYAAGRMPGLPLCAPAGGVNHITTTSLSEAILGGFERGEGGKAYLVGDENLSWKAYLEMYCEFAGNPRDLEVSEDEHPMFPDVMLYAGRNALITYEPDNAELAYSRGQLRDTIKAIVAAYI